MEPGASTSRTPYDDFETVASMHADCVQTETNLHLRRAAAIAVANQPLSLHFEDYPREVPKRDITVSEAAARLANALHLHLD